MGRNQVIVGLEIGTTKVSAVVAEGRRDGGVRILGIGETPSKGVRKGEIVDFSTTVKCVREALVDAEEKSDVEIETVWAAVTGSHITSFNNRGAITIPEDKAEIDLEDLRDVEMNAKEVNIPSHHDFLHTLIQQYYVDGQDGVVDPIGMIGTRLEADFHVVHGVTTRLQNTIRCIREAEVEVEDIVLSSIASAQSVLNFHQKELGTLVVDIGGGVTDYIAYSNGIVRCSGVFAIGGDHITNDISMGLHIPIQKAEKLKIENGSASLEDSLPGDTIILKSDTGFAGCEVERRMLNTIIYARIRELFELLKRQVENECPLHLLGAGMILTGGCSLLRGIKNIAEEVFEIPIHLTRAQAIAGPTSAFENPRLSTPIGVVKYAHTLQAGLPQKSFLEKISTRVESFFEKLRMS